MDETSTLLQYSALDPTKQEIRLIDLSLDEFGVARCLLEIHSIDKAPPFAALSYVWGDARITENILVIKRVFPATINLFHALRYADSAWKAAVPGRELSEMRLWVDAICINQGDFDERNSQVAMMADIYKGAEVVLSWLGLGDSELENGLATFDLISRTTSHLSTAEIESLQWMRECPSLCEAAPAQESEYEPQLVRGNTAWNSMKNVFELPYWSRVWIFQEVSLACKLLFYTSETAVDLEVMLMVWESLGKVSRAVRNPKWQRPDFQSESVCSFMSGQFWNWTILERVNAGRIRANSYDEIDDVLAHESAAWMLSTFARGLLATNPKDHIYGLLALTNLDLKVNCDPKISIARVYADYTAKLVDFHVYNKHPDLETHELFILSWAGCGVYENKFRLPTWAPNYPEESTENLAGIETSADADLNVFPAHVEPARVEGINLFASAFLVGGIKQIESAPAETSWYDGSMLEFAKRFASQRTRYTTPLETIVRIIRLQHDKVDVPANHLYYALHFLEFLVAYDVLEFQSHLQGLGIEWQDFSSSFPAAFRSKNTDNEPRRWKDAFYTGDEELRRESRVDLNEAVISDLTMLRKRWRFFESLNGYIGLCPIKTMATDAMYILNGCGNPVMSRDMGDHYEFVGICFVPDLMNGEARILVEEKNLEVQRVCLR